MEEQRAAVLHGRRAIAVATVVSVLIATLALSTWRAPGTHAATIPTFVQQVGAHSFTTPSLGVTPGANITSGNRLVVEVGVWNSQAATISGVSDSAGNTYTLVLRFAASEKTEMTLWTAPVTNGGGTRPTITATATTPADIGIVALEYSGLSAAPGTASVDAVANATGKTTSAGTVVFGPDRPGHGRQRARHRLLRRLGIHPDPDARRRVHAAREHLPGR